MQQQPFADPVTDGQLSPGWQIDVLERKPHRFALLHVNVPVAVPPACHKATWVRGVDEGSGRIREGDGARAVGYGARWGFVVPLRDAPLPKDARENGSAPESVRRVAGERDGGVDVERGVALHVGLVGLGHRSHARGHALREGAPPRGHVARAVPVQNTRGPDAARQPVPRVTLKLRYAVQGEGTIAVLDPSVLEGLGVARHDTYAVVQVDETEAERVGAGGGGLLAAGLEAEPRSAAG